MPSGLSDATVNAILDKIAGATADTSLLGATLYLDLLTTAPTDDNGTGAVSWGQGRVSVAVANATNWPAASGRQKVSATLTTPTNASGADITVVAIGWYTAATGGTYKGGGPVSGSSLTVPAGAAATVTATLASPSP